MVNKSKSSWNEPAPGELELLRLFLNTWKIPNDTRVPMDTLPGLLRDPSAWDKSFPGVPRGPGDAEDLLMRFRDDLRGALDRPQGWEESLNRWFELYPVVARVANEAGEVSVRYKPYPETGFAGWAAAVIAQAVKEGTWGRLKACPDCRWVFYDHTRSKTKVWCGMFAGNGGRACGTIAKVRRYRQRRRGDGSVGDSGKDGKP